MKTLFQRKHKFEFFSLFHFNKPIWSHELHYHFWFWWMYFFHTRLVKILKIRFFWTLTVDDFSLKIGLIQWTMTEKMDFEIYHSAVSVNIWLFWMNMGPALTIQLLLVEVINMVSFHAAFFSSINMLFLYSWSCGLQFIIKKQGLNPEKISWSTKKTSWWVSFLL